MLDIKQKIEKEVPVNIVQIPHSGQTLKLMQVEEKKPSGVFPRRIQKKKGKETKGKIVTKKA